MRVFLYSIKVFFIILTTCFQAQDDIFIPPSTSNENPIISGVIHVKANTILSLGNKGFGQLIKTEESADINLGHVFKQTFANHVLVSQTVLKVSQTKKITLERKPLSKVDTKLMAFPLQQFFKFGNQWVTGFFQSVQRLYQKTCLSIIDKIRFNIFFKPLNKSIILTTPLLTNGRMLFASFFSRPPPSV